MFKYLLILLFFSTAIIHAQDTLQVKERRFFKNMYLASEVGRRVVYPVYFKPYPVNPNENYSIPLINVKLSQVNNYFKIETGINLFAYFRNVYESAKYVEYNLEGEELLMFVSGGINTLFFLKNPKAISCIVGSSYYYQPYNAFTQEHIADQVYIKKPANVLSFDIQLKWKRLALTYQRWNYIKNIKATSDFFSGISYMFFFSYYQPLYRTKNEETLSYYKLRKQRFDVVIGFNQSLSTHRNSSKFYREDKSNFEATSNLSAGFAYCFKNSSQQLNAKIGPTDLIGLTVEYSLLYNLQPLFNSYKSSFTGIEFGYHYSLYPKRFGDFHLGVVHQTSSNWFFGLSNYVFTPQIEYTSSSINGYFLPSARYTSSHIELKFGRYIGVWKK